MGMGYDDSDLAPMNLLGMSLDEYLMLNGWIDIHDDSHVLSSAGDIYRHVIRVPDDATHRYFARVRINVNTKAIIEMTRNPTLASGSLGSGSLATVNNILDGFALRTAIEIRQGALASGIFNAGSGMNWHSLLGASGANPSSQTLGGLREGTWRGLDNDTTYLLTATALDNNLSNDLTIEITSLKVA